MPSAKSESVPLAPSAFGIQAFGIDTRPSQSYIPSYAVCSAAL